MVKEFRDFVMRGNVIDLAVAVVIAGAFRAVIDAFVADILTPLLGILGPPRLLDAGLFSSATRSCASAEFLNASSASSSSRHASSS